MEIFARLNLPITQLACDSERQVVRPQPRSQPPKRPQLIASAGTRATLSSLLLQIGLQLFQVILISLTSSSSGGGASRVAAERMVRLCIASVDPVKLSSQCVMCNRREFPLTVIDCTGITKVNDLIASPLSVQEATCLIYNCRRQVPDVKPEPYHGSVSHAANYRSAASSVSGYLAPSPAGTLGPMGPAGPGLHEMMTPSGIYGGAYSMAPILAGALPHSSPFMSRYGAGLTSYRQAASGTAGSAYLPLGPLAPRGLIGGPSYLSDRGRGPLPYALVPAPTAFPFGRNKYKMALMPLFK